MVTLLIFLLILSILVLIHEAGHYFVAKKLGIKVEEFGFGIPPRLWGKKIGETIYSINWLPIGGFVKLYGEDDAGAGRVGIKNLELKNKDDKRAFYNKSVTQRAAVVVAGVVMNAILAAVIFYAFMVLSGFTTQLPLLGNHKFFLVDQKNNADIVISAVAKGSPAEEAGLTSFSKILAVNGKKVTDINEFVTTITAYKGRQLELSWQDLKTNAVRKEVMIPRKNPPKNEGALGIAFVPMDVATLTYKTPVQKTLSGIVHPLNLLTYNFHVIKQLVATSVKEKTTAPIGQTVSGPVGIFFMVGDMVKIPDAKERALQVLNLAGLLSVSLAFFNILPIPALDGGRLFFILWEGVTKKKVNPKIETMAHAIGMAVLLSLIALITLQDILKRLPQ
jgi:regulator of sigma E protease